MVVEQLFLLHDEWIYYLQYHANLEMSSLINFNGATKN